jgi:DnaJ-class molecular chaperone
MDYTYLYFMLIFSGCTFLGIIISLILPGAWKCSHCNGSGNKKVHILEQIVCPDCGGTGMTNEKHIRYIKEKCQNCHGTGKETTYQEEEHEEYGEGGENEWGQVVYESPPILVRSYTVHVRKETTCSVCGGKGIVSNKVEDYICLLCSGKGNITTGDWKFIKCSYCNGKGSL